jgi:hypothetical protein
MIIVLVRILKKFFSIQVSVFVGYDVGTGGGIEELLKGPLVTWLKELGTGCALLFFLWDLILKSGSILQFHENVCSVKLILNIFT